MKKSFFSLIAMLLCMTLCACSSLPSATTPTVTHTPEPTAKVEEPQQTESPEDMIDNFMSDLSETFDDALSGFSSAETYETPTPTEESLPEPTPEATETPEPTSTPELVDGMRPEFIEAMDSYEEFFEEYCEFLDEYAKNPDSLTLLAKYATFTLQYQETMTKLEAMGEEEMNDAELKHYTKTLNRINEMLLDHLS